MKKSPPTPDVNAKSPRPTHISSEDPPVPTIDAPPEAPSETATGFDRATAASEQEHRSGQLPDADDDRAIERTLQDDDMERELDAEDELEGSMNVDRDANLSEGVDPVKYSEFWAERQSFPQQDDPDLEESLEERSERPDIDNPVNTGNKQPNDPERDTSGSVRPTDEPSDER